MTIIHLIIECQLTNVLIEGMVKLENHHQSAITVIIDSAKNHQCWGFPGGSIGKESTRNAGDLGSIPEVARSPGGGHGNPTHFRFLAWRIPWAEEPGGLQSMGSQRVDTLCD